MRQRGWKLLAKLAFDRGVAAGGLLVSAPLLGATAIAIRSTMGRPVLFRQERSGLEGRTIELIKFRTMTNARDSDDNLLPDERRFTGLGRILRATSLDELPQLWSVLKGDLSLVGPRPLLKRYLQRFTPEQARRHDVLPGITGWAQVNGRNAISWEEKFALDIWYADNWSLMLDAQILALTILRVLLREGISSEGHATMPEFLGSQAEAERAA